MKVTPENMANLTTAVKAQFNKGLGRASNIHTRICAVVKSNVGIESYPLTLVGTRMRAFVGERVLNEVGLMKLDVANETFEDTVVFPRAVIEDDQYATRMPAIAQLGATSANLPDQLLADQLNNNTSKWMDGAVFFANRKIGKSTINNKGTAALSYDAFKAAYNTMMSYKDHNGVDPLLIRPTVLMVGNALYLTAKALIENKTRIVNGATVDNELYGIVEVVLNPFITGNKWFLVDDSNVIKPFVYQDRADDGIVSKTKADDDHVFMKDEFVYGTRKRGAIAPLVPQLIYGSYPA